MESWIPNIDFPFQLNVLLLNTFTYVIRILLLRRDIYTDTCVSMVTKATESI